jgi:plastocyanin
MKTFRLAAALAALTVALAACGGGSSSSSSTPPPAAGGGSSGGGGSSSGGAGNGMPVDVTLADFSINVAGGTKLKPGTYTFNVTNNGPTAHNLTIEGPGVDNQATPTFTSGSQSLTVTLKKGSYDFFCSVPGHKEAGMNLDVTVGGGGGAAGGGSTEDSGGGGGSNEDSSSGGGSTESGGGWG